MDNSWQNKCWQSSTTLSMASSSHESQNQDSRITVGGTVGETMSLNTLNSGSHRSNHDEVGNSFLAILSGPPSLLQYDFKQLSDPKPLSTFSTLPTNSSRVMIGAAGSGVPLTPIVPLTENLGNHNLRSGADLRAVVSSMEATSSNCSSLTVLRNDHQAANFYCQSQELAEALTHNTFPGVEKVRDVSSPRGGWPAAMNAASSRKLHSTNVQVSQKMPSDKFASVSSSTFMSGCPRVSCLGKSGSLLLSNTGLLGVVCSCHCLHMSISKFCEHSGLVDVNPGDAVRLDSGQIIAQWRKLYFQKFGIRDPGNQSGWDWPEWFSATAGLVKSSSSVANMSRSSDLSSLVGSSKGLAMSWDTTLCSKHTIATHNPVNDVLHKKQQKNIHDSCDFLLKNFTGTPESNIRTVADNQKIECPLSWQSTTVMLGQEGHVNVDKDTASSNIELRLGQPNQQSDSLGNSFLSVIGLQRLDTLGDPEKSLSPEQLTKYKDNFRVTEKCRQYPHFAAGTPNSRNKQSQSNIMGSSSRINDFIDADKLQQYKGDGASNSVISILFSRLNTPYEGNVHSKASYNMANGSEHITPKTLHCEPHLGKSDLVNFPRSSADGPEKHLNNKKSGFHRYMDEDKGVGCVADGAYVARKSDHGLHNLIYNSHSFNGVIDGSNNLSSSSMHNRNFYSRQLTGMPLDASDAIKFLDYSKKVPCFGNSGHLDNVSFRSLSSPMGSILPPQAESVGFSSAASTSISNLTPAFLNKEGIGVNPNLMDKNLVLFPARHLMEFSKQGHATASLGMNQQHGKFSHSSDVKIQGVDLLASEDQRHGPIFPSKEDAIEVAMKSLHSDAMHIMGGDSDKLAPVTGPNNWNFSISIPGIPLCSKEFDMQCQCSHGPLPNKQSLLRLGGSENNTYSCEYCSCTVHTNFFGGNSAFKGETSHNFSTEQVGKVGCKASTLVASDLDKDYNNNNQSLIPTTWGRLDLDKDYADKKEENISLGKSRKLIGQTLNKIDCCTFQWKDVPRKVTEVCNVTRLDCPADGPNGRRNDEDQLADTAAKTFHRTVQEVDIAKEQEMSNISSGCSTPAVTQVSVEVKNLGSCTFDAGDTRYANDVVDEGSIIDSCWSTDDALDSERSAEFLSSTCKSNPVKERTSKALVNQSSHSLIDGVKLVDSSRWKKVPTGLTVHGKTNHFQKSGMSSKTKKIKRAQKWKMLDASGLSSVNYESSKCIGSSEIPSHSAYGMKMLSDQRPSHQCDPCSVGHNFNWKNSPSSSSKHLFCKRDLDRLYNHREQKDDNESNNADDFLKVPDVSHGKRLRLDCQADDFKQARMQELNHGDSVTNSKFITVDSLKESSSQKLCIGNRKTRPVVCGQYGILSNRNSTEDVSKPVKIVSLTKILKTSRRCSLLENAEFNLTSARELKKTILRKSDECFDGLSLKDPENHDVTVCNETLKDFGVEEDDPETSVEMTEKVCFSGDEEHADDLLMLKKERNVEREKTHDILDSYCSSGIKPKTGLKPTSKEIRKTGLHELIVKDKKSSSANFPFMKISKCGPPQKKCRYAGKVNKIADDSDRDSGDLCNVNANKPVKDHGLKSISYSDASCCVCGSSNNDEINCIVQCNQCFIRVHRACYGVARVPKCHWYCRPCRTSSKNIACVLCGYGGGAMTHALHTRNIVKSLLAAWEVEIEYKPMNNITSDALKDKLSILDSSRSELEGDVNIGPSSTEKLKNVPNSITTGLLDSTVKQWVHMVCGLWTPETRCPNVDTMSTFDVSGVSPPKPDMVCSICNRRGGSCIECRVLNCSVQFHPWCAHQKGLLQSENEGVNNESVGFYGRCVLHGKYEEKPMDIETNDLGEEELLTCARTEGNKGCIRDSFHPNCQTNRTGCLVPQEQLNAWLHINGQKSCLKGFPKQPILDIELDFRKEYARYKQSKRWKQLVVYKSGIHALGLYTSRFITRGALVVEYVGEIIGLRIADKREIEYQTGRRLQYKSACYFFRIDKEHIIDATCKGGIARFVNHSCQPNCVAKVISVRNVKKVVFFAERDVYPGEEITYDYHFNHEDEGEKIPCFCNSKNCRRYLN